MELNPIRHGIVEIAGVNGKRKSFNKVIGSDNVYDNIFTDVFNLNDVIY